MISPYFLQKLATEYDLKPYQQRVVNRISDNNNREHGFIALHSMGSGKTLTALKSFDEVLKNNPGTRGLYVVPATLVSRAPQEMKEYGLGHLANKVDVISYERAAKDALKLQNKNYSLVALDEAHRLRNKESKRARAIQHIMDKSPKTLLLTGTAGYNHPADIFALINRIDPKQKLPETHVSFNSKFINDSGDEWELKNKRTLSRILNKYVDRYEVPRNNEHFPSFTKKIVNVEMVPEQEEIYKYLEGSLPPMLAYKVRNNLPLSLQEATKLDVYSQGIRQASNSPQKYNEHLTEESAPKMQAAVKSLVQHAEKIPGFRGIVYSNYLGSSLTPYTKLLKKHGIKPLVYTGQCTDKERASIVKQYNQKSNTPKVLLLSSAGGEGLDLKRTNLMQVLEPHFNESKIDQAQARAIRYNSHIDLPKEQQKVEIEEYHTVFPKSRFITPTSIDTTLSKMSDKKQAVINEMYDMVGKPLPPMTIWEQLFGEKKVI